MQPELVVPWDKRPVLPVNAALVCSTFSERDAELFPQGSRLFSAVQEGHDHALSVLAGVVRNLDMAHAELERVVRVLDGVRLWRDVYLWGRA